MDGPESHSSEGFTRRDLSVFKETRGSHPSRDRPRRGGDAYSCTAVRAERPVGGESYHRTDEPEEKLFEETISVGINFDKYDDIPVEKTGRDCPEEVDSFAAVNLGKVLKTNIEKAKFSKPTPVQRHAIPIILRGRDLMACAQTGSGKTAAFLFPCIAEMLRQGPPPIPEDMRPREGRWRSFPVALIISPTRELATQTYDQCRKFTMGCGIRAVVVYGGSDIRFQSRELQKGCDIIVATPGRLNDLLERGWVSLCCVRHLILDEADRMLDMGFEPQIRQIVDMSDMPVREDRQTLMFSATFPKEIQQLASDFLNDYIFLTVGRVGSTTENITQKIEMVPERERAEFVEALLRQTPGLTLIFVETRRKADTLEDLLLRHDVSCTSIHSDRSQSEREDALQSFRLGKTRVLVATDIAARGLDIPNVMHVINFDLPRTIDDYVHRIGRTGRAGNSGLATSLFGDADAPLAHTLVDLLRESNQDVPVWLDRQATGGSRSFGGHTRGRGRFGARDYRFHGGPSRGHGRSDRSFHEGGDWS